MFGAACQPVALLLFLWRGVVLWGESDQRSRGLSYSLGSHRAGVATWPSVHLSFRCLSLFKQQRNPVLFLKTRLSSIDNCMYGELYWAQDKKRWPDLFLM